MLNKLIYNFIPQEYLKHEDEKRKAKLTAASMLIVFGFSINYIFISYFLDYNGGIYSQVQMFIMSVICLFLFKNKANILFVNILFFVSSTISIATTVFFTKGYESFILPWFSALPVVTLLLTNKKGGLIMLIACIIMISVFYGMYINGYLLTEEYNLEFKNLFSYSTHIGLVLILYVVALVFENTKNTALQNLDIRNRQLDIQKKNVEAKQKEIVDSIGYAKKIQESILPADKLIKQFLPDSFILYKPKDIVSGDFYWVTKWGSDVLFATVDCTGHGVPGAFMSIVGQNLLSQTVNEYGISKPNLILNMLNKGIAKTLNQNTDKEELKDGMDISLCSLNTQHMHIEFAGAYSPVWIVRQNELIEVKGDKFPIGSFLDDKEQFFQNHIIPIKQGDIIYILTDGYPDQFGGPKGKKFGHKKLKNLLLEISNSPLSSQKEALNNAIESWRAQSNEQQTDDILIMGVKI